MDPKANKECAREGGENPGKEGVSLKGTSLQGKFANQSKLKETKYTHLK
jgi:hypothetical protein